MIKKSWILQILDSFLATEKITILKLKSTNGLILFRGSVSNCQLAFTKYRVAVKVSKTAPLFDLDFLGVLNVSKYFTYFKKFWRCYSIVTHWFNRLGEIIRRVSKYRENYFFATPIDIWKFTPWIEILVYVAERTWGKVIIG